MEVNIDYPEYDDVEEMTSQLMLTTAKHIEEKIEQLLKTATQGKILREGLQTAIIGRPNVGKSSLLNYLLDEKKRLSLTLPERRAMSLKNMSMSMVCH